MSFFRVQKWRTFARQWYLYDAYMQCPMLSGEKIAAYLKGTHKRIYDPRGDVGDSVIVFNSRNIAAKDNSSYWRRFLYTTHTRFGPFRVEDTMAELHKRDPTEVIRREIRVHLPNRVARPDWLARLHIFPDGIETVPEELLKNVSGVIRQVMPVPKRLDSYTAEEIENYPKLFDWPDDYAVGRLSPLTKPRPRAGKTPK
ncbi:hypothetical protein AAHC03_04630 [Spirometra sp. Aus1]|nr:unnamed protein product [Spirometra erinaceieuropaei]